MLNSACAAALVVLTSSDPGSVSQLQFGRETVFVANAAVEQKDVLSAESGSRVVTATKVADVTKLRELKDGWDGEGAPVVADRAISLALEMVSWAEVHGLLVTDVDADVLGGVAVWVEGPGGGRRAWLSLMNNARDTVLLMENGKTLSSGSLSERSRESILSFLKTTPR